MQLPPPWWGTWASGLLLRWQLQLGMYSVGFFFFSPGYVALWDSKTPHRPVEGFPIVETSPPSQLPPQDADFCFFLFFFFSILSYLLLKRMGCLSECLVSSASIVLWKLFNIQMSFWWICGRESGLLSYSFAILGPPRGIFHGPTDLCVCCNIQQENRKLKTLKFKLHGYRICNVNLIILKFFLKLDQNHLGLLKQIAFYVSISDLVCLGWVLKFAFLTSSR